MERDYSCFFFFNCELIEKIFRIEYWFLKIENIKIGEEGIMKGLLVDVKVCLSRRSFVLLFRC